MNQFGYLPSGLQESALICSSLLLRRKSTRVHRVPEPLESVPKYEAAPGLMDAALPGYEAAQMQIPPLKFSPITQKLCGLDAL